MARESAGGNDDEAAGVSAATTALAHGGVRARPAADVARALGDALQRRPEPGERALLASQDVDLRVHQRRAAGRRRERRGSLAVLGEAGVLLPVQRGHPFARLVPAQLVTARFSFGLLHQQLDLGELQVELGDLLLDLLDQPREARRPLGHQSSGMRIQPCFIA